MTEKSRGFRALGSCFLRQTFLAALFSVNLLGGDVRYFGITKLESFTQDADAPPNFAGPGAFTFYVFVTGQNSNLISQASVSSPDNTSIPLSGNPDSITLDFADYYDGPEMLDLAYPLGSYTLNFVSTNDGRKGVTLDLPEPFYPNAPLLLNWVAAQILKADQSFTFQWEPFSEGTTNDFVQLSIYDTDGNFVFATADQPGVPGALDGTLTSFPLSANTLALGTTYRGYLSFTRISSRDTTSDPGALGVAGFVRETDFPIGTAGTPDLPQVRLGLAFTYLGYGGDFLRDATPQPPFPITLEDCYYVDLSVQNEEFYPIASDVTFSSPPGTIWTNVPAEFRFEQGVRVLYEPPCLPDPTNSLAGSWTIGYNAYPIAFTVADAEAGSRLLVPIPTAAFISNELAGLTWSYHDPAGNVLSQVPAFLTNQVVEIFDTSNLSLFLSSNLPPTVADLTLPNPLQWDKVGRVTISYQDSHGNWFVLSFDHSPPGDLAIVTDLLPRGSLTTPYSAQFVASNGVPPFIWSLDDGQLPNGLVLDKTTGTISGIPQAKGTFHFAIRVDDQAHQFEQDQFFITITSNGPPVIVEQPKGGSVDVGDFAPFEVVADGTEPLAYQWFFNANLIPRETNSSLELINVTVAQAGDYSVLITNGFGAITSRLAHLFVLSPPIVTQQPLSQSVPAGSNVTLSVTAVSAPPLFYQWQLNGEYIDGATNSTYQIIDMQPANAGAYSVLVAGPEGLAESDDATLTLVVEAVALTNRFANRVQINSPSGLGRGNNRGANREPGEPDHAGIPGGTSVWITWVAPAAGIAMFTTRGSSFDTLLAVYSGTNVAALAEVASDDDGADFFTSLVRFNALAGTAYQIAIDGVYGGEGEILLNWDLDTSGGRLPVILVQPRDAVVAEGASATFTLVATNLPPLTARPSYQWYFEGNLITNATNSSLTIPNVTFTNLGLYFAEVSNNTESILSAFVVIQENISDGNLVDSTVSTADKFADLPRLSVASASQLRPSEMVRKSSLGVARGFTGTQIFSTIGSTREAGEPNHCNVPGGASQWFSYQAPTDGLLTVSTDGSDFDTILAVYTGPGTDFASLKLVSCDNDSGADGRDSLLRFSAQAGTLYFVVIDGVQGATGIVRLQYRLEAQSNLRAAIANNQLRLFANGSLGQNFTIESSSNLVTWGTVFVTNNAAGAFEWLDLDFSNQRRRFYRAFRNQ